MTVAIPASELATVIRAALSAKMAELYPQSAAGLAGLAEYHSALASAIAEAMAPHLATPKKDKP